MPRHEGSHGIHRTTKQKGLRGARAGIGTYSRKKKGKHADRYDRPYITGIYRRNVVETPEALEKGIRRANQNG